MENKKLEVKILGEKQLKEYYACSVTKQIRTIHQTIDTPLLWEGELDYPPFEAGDSIYIDDLGTEVYITNIVRSTSNKYVYHTNRQVELIEDERTEQSLIEAKEKLAEFIENAKIRSERKKLEEAESQKSKLRKIIDIIKS